MTFHKTKELIERATWGVLSHLLKVLLRVVRGEFLKCTICPAFEISSFPSSFIIFYVILVNFYKPLWLSLLIRIYQRTQKNKKKNKVQTWGISSRAMRGFDYNCHVLSLVPMFLLFPWRDIAFVSEPLHWFGVGWLFCSERPTVPQMLGITFCMRGDTDLTRPVSCVSCKTSLCFQRSLILKPRVCVFFAFEPSSLRLMDVSHGWPVDMFSGLMRAGKMPLADFVDLTQDTFFFFLACEYLTSLSALCQREPP